MATTTTPAWARRRAARQLNSAQSEAYSGRSYEEPGRANIVQKAFMAPVNNDREARIQKYLAKGYNRKYAETYADSEPVMQSQRKAHLMREASAFQPVTDTVNARPEGTVTDNGKTMSWSSWRQRNQARRGGLGIARIS